MLKSVSRAARNSSRNAAATATTANSSGISRGTSARNSTIRMKKRAIRPMISLAPCSGGGLSASPVNSTWMPDRLADRPQLILEIDHVVARQLESGPVELGVEEGDPAALRELPRVLGERVGDRARVLRVLVQRSSRQPG